MWYAKEKGWDKEVGLDFNILYFDSGMGMLEALPAKQWGIGALGGTPAVVGAARYGTKIIAIGNDESMANVVLVRPDSPIMKVKGWNPKYPNVYGSPETHQGQDHHLHHRVLGPLRAQSVAEGLRPARTATWSSRTWTPSSAWRPLRPASATS